MLRPLLFFAAFLGAIVLPQALGHWLNHLYPAAAGLAEDEDALRATAAGFADPGPVFGASVRRELLQDARPVYPQVLQAAFVAQLGLTGDGASVLAARFDSAAAAKGARSALFAMLGKVTLEDDGKGVIRFTWPQSGQAAIVAGAGRTLMLWVAADREAVERLRAESRALRQSVPPARTGVGGFVDAVRGWPLSRYLSVIGAYALLVSWLFLRLASWATEVPARAVAQPASAATLKERLLAVRFLDAPIAIAPGRNDRQLVVDWKYADARWLDQARAHGMRKSHRLILEIDEATRTVRCREFHSESEWGAGGGGAAMRWSASWEIVFYQYEHERVFGLQLGSDGALAPALSYAYTFDIREMKNPLIAAITESGWQWRQVFFFSPPWLRWLHG